MNGKKTADVIIIGAGPAGISAAVWCADLGLSSVLLEKESEAGGQMLRIYNPVTNYPGLETANGRELSGHFLRTLERSGSPLMLSADVVEIDTDGRSVTIGSGERLHADALILATGVRRRRLNVPGEAEFAGKGIIDSGSNEKEKARGKTVVIAGGGDAALENALILAEYAAKVYVVHRRAGLRARPGFVEKANAHPKIEIRFETSIVSIKGTEKVEAVELKHSAAGAAEMIETDIVLARIGVEPNTDLVGGKLELDDQGYVVVNAFCETSAAGVYAAGDCANAVSPTVVTAAGMGAAAAKAIKAFSGLSRPM
jgi:thioredoxin reductase (NADPH)